MTGSARACRWRGTRLLAVAVLAASGTAIGYAAWPETPRSGISTTSAGTSTVGRVAAATGDAIRVRPASLDQAGAIPTRRPPITHPPTAAPVVTPFPGAGNTGIPAGTVLHDYTGPREITTPNTVIRGVRFTPGSRITISAPGVVIRESLFQTYDTWDLSMNDHVPDASVDVYDSEFAGYPGDFVGGEMAVRGEHWRLHRVNIHDYRDGGGIDGDNLVEDSWVHNFHVSSACEHADGFQSIGDASDIVIRHNTIDMALHECMAGLVQLGNENGPNSNVTVEDNWLAGGSFMFYASMAPSDYPTHDIRFIDNHLSRKYFPDYGGYGIVNYWKPGTPGAEWYGNVDANTGKVIPAP